MANLKIDAGSEAAGAALATPSGKSKAHARGGKTKKAAIAPATSGAVAFKAGKVRPSETKAEIVLKKLRLAKGATLDQLTEATGWQAHSVRGFLSGTVKKKLGHALTSEIGKDGVRRYRIDDFATAG